MQSVAINMSAQQPSVEEIRAAAQQLVGQTFFSTLLKIGQDNGIEPRFGHGGRGEEVFRGELNNLLAERAASSFDVSLTDAITRQLARQTRTFQEGS
jgi:hypothetical protein